MKGYDFYIRLFLIWVKIFSGKALFRQSSASSWLLGTIVYDTTGLDKVVAKAALRLNILPGLNGLAKVGSMLCLFKVNSSL